MDSMVVESEREAAHRHAHEEHAAASSASSASPASSTYPPSLEFNSLQELLGHARMLATLQEVPTQERLWQLLDNLECLKQVCGESEEEREDESNLQLLYEAEEALLPLIAAHEHMHSQEEQQRRGADERLREASEKRELAAFDVNFRLQLHAENWAALFARSDKHSISNTVAFLGDTHVGKSTLLAHTLRACTEGQEDIAVASPQQNAPTTANVRVYDSHAVGEIGTIRFLDMEGENGGQPPRDDSSSTLRMLLASMGNIAYQQRRRAAVSEHVPRLAFVTSDVVVYVSNESFSSAAYMARVRRLATDSTESVDSAYSPALVLVYNKCSLDEELDPEACTRTFFENKEHEDLARLYTEVVCICIPHYEQMKKVRRPGQPSIMIDGEEIFEIQLKKMMDIIYGMLQRRLMIRQERGSIFSEHVWCILFKLVLEQFHRKLRMADLLTSIMRPRSAIASKGFNYFSELYRFVGRYDKEHFLRCRKAAIVMVAFLFVEHMRMKQLEYDKYIINALRSDFFRREIRVALEELCEHADKLAPCDAVLPDHPGEEIRCTQERLCHTGNHRSSQKVYGAASASSEKSMRALENFRAWIGIGYRPTWEGQHTFSYPHPLEHDVAQCEALVGILSKVLPSAYYPTKMGILQSVARYSATPAASNQSSFCWLCLTGQPDRTLEPCGHVFCADCMHVLSHISLEQVPLELDEFGDLASEQLSAHHCPLCHTAIEGVQRRAIPFRSLQQKYLNIFSSTMIGSLARVSRGSGV